MNLKEQLLSTLEENGIKVQKIKGRERTLYKINGNYIYITFKENSETTKDLLNYYLQIREKSVRETLDNHGNLTILIICGSLSQIIVFQGKEFQKITEDVKVNKDGNIKFNVFITKRKIDAKIRFTEKGVVDVNKYVNAIENCELDGKIINIIKNLQKEIDFESITPHEKVIVPHIKPIIHEKVSIDKSIINSLLCSGDGSKLEKFLIDLFEFWGFEVDKETSGKSGELDVICTRPFLLGVECRSTRNNVGVNIVDELNRHLRRYESKTGISDMLGFIICNNPTVQLIEDSITEKRFVINYESFVELIQYSIDYPFSPFEFQNFISDFGNIENNLKKYLDEKRRKISLRETIIAFFENTNEVMGFADIKAHFKVYGIKISNE